MDEAIRQVFFISLEEVNNMLEKELGEAPSLKQGEVYIVDTGKSIWGEKLLTLMNMNNVRLFMLSSMAVYLLFALIYTMIYRMTSRVYYGLVTEADT